MSNTTNGHKSPHDKKLSSQHEYLKLLPELRDCIVREQQLFNLIKRVGRNAGYAQHEIQFDAKHYVDDACKLIDRL
jgi:hypothetical protein